MFLIRKLSAWTLGVCVITGCEGESIGPQHFDPHEVEIDASSATSYAYFNLASGSIVQPADPSNSTEWDLALRYYEVRLNAGVIGTKGVLGYNLANNVNATADEVLAFTADNQKPAFDSIGAGDIPDDSEFVGESLVASPLGWLSFGSQGPAANPQAAWKVRRTSGGGHAVFKTTGLTISGSDPQTATLTSVTVSWRYQAPGGDLGPTQSATIDLTSANVALNFATGELGPATGCGWDLKAGADFALTMNSGCDVGTFPLLASETFDGLTKADDALEYGGFLSGISGPIPYSAALDDYAGPYLYDLAGDNRVSPTFNIYLIKVGNQVYKIQFIDYYSATGASRHPTIRFQRIQ